MIKGLTTFRAFAFFAVFFFHTGYFDAGYLGVQAFFVLSGFLLTPIIIEMKMDLNTKEFFKNFYGRRFLRIFPLYYAYLIIVTIFCVFLVYGLKNQFNPEINRFISQLPWAFTYTYNFYHASYLYEHTHLVTHFWSLAIEEQFYLFWPLLIFYISSSNIKKMLMAIMLAGPLIRLCVSMIALGNLSEYFTERVDIVIYVLTFSHIDAFATGAYFALYRKSTSNYLLISFMMISIFSGVLTSMSFSHKVTLTSLGYGPFMKDTMKYVWGYSILNIIFAWILVQVRDGIFLPKLFNNGILNYLGKISYGLYVFHFGAIWIVGTIVSINKVSIFFLSLILTVLASIISYELMEKRILNLKHKLFPRKVAS